MQSAVFAIGEEELVEEKKYLVCERKSVFALLTVSAGMMGAYTFNLRGGVFCNAQTANVVLMAMAIGQGNWLEGGYYLLPISAYLAGAFLSEILPSPVRRFGFLRWDTYLVAFEVLLLFLIGFIPLSWPHHLVQVLVNFIASMQYNTFRQASPWPPLFAPTNCVRWGWAWPRRCASTTGRGCIGGSSFWACWDVFLQGVCSPRLCAAFSGQRPFG